MTRISIRQRNKVEKDIIMPELDGSFGYGDVSQFWVY